MGRFQLVTTEPRERGSSIGRGRTTRNLDLAGAVCVLIQ